MDELPKHRTILNAKIPRPNDNVTMKSMFRDTVFDAFLDGLKRVYGNSVAHETTAPVVNSIEVMGLSVNHLDRLLMNGTVRAEYGLGQMHPDQYIE